MRDDHLLIGASAYCKMILHAIKYPHLTVRGVLLGTRQAVKSHQSDDGEEAGNGVPSPTQTTTVLDAIPATHNSLVTPTLELLFIHLDSYCKKEGLSIVGVYFCNQRLGDSQ